MERIEIENLFKENGVNDECSWVYKCRLVEIKILLKDGTKLNLLYGDRIEYIDISDNYVGLGSFLINPISNIERMEVEFR